MLFFLSCVQGNVSILNNLAAVVTDLAVFSKAKKNIFKPSDWHSVLGVAEIKRKQWGPVDGNLVQFFKKGLVRPERKRTTKFVFSLPNNVRPKYAS